MWCYLTKPFSRIAHVHALNRPPSQHIPTHACTRTRTHACTSIRTHTHTRTHTRTHPIFSCCDISSAFFWFSGMYFQILFCHNRDAVAYSNPFVIMLWLYSPHSPPEWGEYGRSVVKSNGQKKQDIDILMWRAQVNGLECFSPFRVQSGVQRFETSARLHFHGAMMLYVTLRGRTVGLSRSRSPKERGLGWWSIDWRRNIKLPLMRTCSFPRRRPW
jgi:hypothetical protein